MDFILTDNLGTVDKDEPGGVSVFASLKYRLGRDICDWSHSLGHLIRAPVSCR
jgi:hypothetical protein